MAEKTPSLRFEHHVIAHQRIGDEQILDAIDVDGRGHVYGVGTLTPARFSATAADVRANGLHQILSFARKDARPDLRFSDPQQEAFQGKHVALAIRNGQSVGATIDWLRWNLEHHGIASALILDRADPDKDTTFANTLKTAIQALPGLQTIMIVQFDLPLGETDLPAESHPFCAPDAPGKDRMQVPAADPWHAPLGQLNVVELLRWRFLNQARSVSLLDISDLLEPAQDQPLIDQLDQTPGGTLLLSGTQAYPWRVRAGQEPQFSDHICTQFDARQKLTRWSIAPAKTPASRLWRPFFMPGAALGSTAPWPFYRYMALRHEADSISKIVPKTSLVQDDILLRHAKSYWNAKPVRVPKQRSKKPSKVPSSVAIVTCMKNEGPFILEWLAYHRVIGVENFLVYTNDCTDGTDSFLDLLQSKGLVQHRDNPFRDTGLKPQHAALHAADDEPMMQQADWVVCMDVDEFINVKAGDGHLRDLFAAVPDANMIAMTWRLFGNSDQHAFHDQPIIGDFSRCAAEMTRKPHQAWGFKTLYRNLGIFKKLGVHRPKGLKPQLWEQINWVNGSGKPMPKSTFRNAWRSTKATVGYDLVTLNHYAVRSAESFLVKRDRGRVNHVDRDQGLAYWFRMNHNLQEDLSIQRMLPALKAEMDRLLTDPEIAEMHEACVAAHRAKIDELKATPNYAAFYETLTGDRMQNLSRKLQHFGANVFLAGPDVVPDEIAFEDHPEGFFFTVEKQETQH
ncbi:glycosyltransferase family 2 protein [Cognatishimia sp.]|uniref:glycosyltransferase family 2 protein n=1 Tax=Cognatishimia sp. TaxID=2211648 RepID=UPI003511EC43|nr:glycosyltransferase family 2 protein [Cognatishimia sp.]